MKLAMAQMKMSADMDENVTKTLRFMEMAKDCDLLFFPEIQWTPFFPQYESKDLKNKTGRTKEELLLTLDDSRIRKLQEKCREYQLWLSPNLYVRQNQKNYDMSLMIDHQGNLKGVSKMVHVFQTEHFYEKDYYTPSEDGFQVYQTPFGKIGIVICFDRHLPESIRSCAVKGAELIIIPTANDKSEPLEMFEWELRVQAFQNNTCIAMCNRTGTEGNMDFAGESLISDSYGNILYKADDREQLIICEMDLTEVSVSRQKRPYIELVRSNMYS